MYLGGDGSLEGFIGGCFIRNVALGGPVMFCHLRGRSRNCGMHADNYKKSVHVELYAVEIHSKHKYTALAWPNILSPLVNAFSTKTKSKSDLLTRFKKIIKLKVECDC